MQGENLLDTLAVKVGCSYLSELCNAREFPLLVRAVAEMPPEKYAANQWNEAINYLLKEEAAFPQPETAKSYLMDRLLHTGGEMGRG